MMDMNKGRSAVIAAERLFMLQNVMPQRVAARSGVSP